MRTRGRRAGAELEEELDGGGEDQKDQLCEPWHTRHQTMFDTSLIVIRFSDYRN